MVLRQWVESLYGGIELVAQIPKFVLYNQSNLKLKSFKMLFDTCSS